VSEIVKYTDVIECGYCGNEAPMRVVGHASDLVTEEAETGESREIGAVYQISVCRTCARPTVQVDDYNEDGPTDWTSAAVHPGPEFLQAKRLFVQRSADLRFMRQAVAEAAKSPSEEAKRSPLVGAVVVRDGALVVCAYRGEMKGGEHAEYTALERKCQKEVLAGATVYTTLEPCTRRNHPKDPCVEHLKSRRVARVVIGMLDPNDDIRGRGVLELRKAGIQVDLFPSDLMNQLEEMNRAFIKDQEKRSLGGDDRRGSEARGSEDKWVGGSYADQAGITAQLQTEGYTAAWVWAQEESERVDLNGWEYVLHNDGGAKPKQLKIKDPTAPGGYLVLLKKKRELIP
jgi:pyrimidine deaminase RibD-like protein